MSRSSPKSRRAERRAWSIPALALGLTCAVGVSAPSVAAAVEGEASLDQLRDQGILYFKRQRYKQAKRMLDLAMRKPGGHDDFMVALYRGMAAEKLLLLEDAFAMADRALALAEKNQQRLRVVGEFQQRLQESYGLAKFENAGGPSRGTLLLDSEAKVFIKQKQAMFLSIRERLRSTEMQLPANVYLPFGEYKAQGVAFAVKRGQTATVAIALSAAAAEDDGGLSPWWYAGAGAAVLAGVGTWLLLQEDEVTTRTDTLFELER